MPMTEGKPIEIPGVPQELLQQAELRGQNPDAHPTGLLFEVINYRPYDGDTKIVWDRNNADEVDAARTMFNSLLKKSFAIFKVNKAGEKDGEQVREFDAAVEKYICIPQMRGG